MNFFKHQAEVSLEFISGRLRVTIRPKTKWTLVFIEAWFIAGFGFMSVPTWPGMSLLHRIIDSAALLGAIIALLKELSGSEEVIEFDDQHLRIERDVFGWSHTYEYAIAQCGKLELSRVEVSCTA